MHTIYTPRPSRRLLVANLGRWIGVARECLNRWPGMLKHMRLPFTLAPNLLCFGHDCVANNSDTKRGAGSWRIMT